MMLHLLIDYAKTHNLVAEPGFKPKQARWAILASKDGRFLGLLDLAGPSEDARRGRMFAKCPDLSFSEIKSTGGGCRHFLLDSAEVAVLYEAESGDPKSQAKHKYFVNLIHLASQAAPDLGSVVTVLTNPETLQSIREGLSRQKAKATDTVTFAMPGRQPEYFVDDPVCHDWWRGFRQSLVPAKGKTSKQSKAGLVPCLASGELVEPMAVHPKVSGLVDVGGQPSGDAFMAFKQDAFRSYGLEQSANAPVSEEMATAYRATLDDLIRHHSRRMANTKIVHWYSGTALGREDDPLEMLFDPIGEAEEREAQHRARRLLESIARGERPDLLGYRYFALTLTGAAGRIMIRDWMEGPFESLARNINAWFDDLSVVSRDGSGEIRPPKFLAILGSMVRDLSEIPRPLEAKMWSAAVRYEAIPEYAVAQALARAKVDIVQDEPANHARMGLIKAYHVRKGDMAMGPYMNEDHPKAAYHCGRLMAVLADLQYAAMGDVGAGIVQRYYAAASATPALILGRLDRLSKAHLGKLEPQRSRWFETRIAAIWGKLQDDPPTTLTLEEQSLFAMGYYQQKAVRNSASGNGDQETQESTEEAKHE